jgi:hypothetical protein
MDFNRVGTYPTKREGWARTVLTGGVLIFLSFLVVPMVVVYGYVVATIRDSLAGEPAPPAFEDWETLLVEGGQAWLIGLLYLLVPLVVVVATVGGSVLAILTGGGADVLAGLGSALVGFTVSAVLSLLFGYVAVAALVNFASERRFGAAFDFDVIGTVVRSRAYAIAWLVSVAVFVLVGIVSMIPLVGWVLTPFAAFYAATVAATLWAGGFEQAVESTAPVVRPGDETAV